MKRWSEVENFRLLKTFSYHPIFKEYLLVGIVGPLEPSSYEHLTRPIEG